MKDFLSSGAREQRKSFLDVYTMTSYHDSYDQLILLCVS